MCSSDLTQVRSPLLVGFGVPYIHRWWFRIGRRGQKPPKSPVQSVSTLILSMDVLLRKVIFRRVKGVMRDPLFLFPQGHDSLETHYIPVIQMVLVVALVMVVVVGWDQISDYPTGDETGSLAPRDHQQTRSHRE